MYEFCLSENINIIEIGTSDGREACLALKRMEEKINSNFYYLCQSKPPVYQINYQKTYKYFQHLNQNQNQILQFSSTVKFSSKIK